MRRCAALVARPRIAVAWTAWLLLLLAGCSAQEALLLLVRTPPSAPLLQRYALTVQDRRSREVLYRSGVQQVDPQADQPRDLSAAALRLGLVLPRRGTYFVHLRGGGADLQEGPRAADAADGGELFFAALLDSAGETEVDAPLLPVSPAEDRDGDRFPDATAWPAASPAAAARYAGRPELLDCLDRDPQPGEAPLPGGLSAAEVNPLARPRCGLPLDASCSGGAPACLDADGDGDPEGSDCDDRDPRRYHGNPRPRNCCACDDRRSCEKDHGKRADLSACAPPRCDDDFDYDCSGLAVDCFTDEDCDGYSPDDPVPGQRDCDDTDPRVHPGAQKDCKDPSKDWACDGNPRGGCVDCDLDGDGYQRRDDPSDPGAHCPSTDDRNPGQVDCDDEDRGVFPGSTRAEGATLLVRDLDGKEGGTVAAALRGLCRNTTPEGKPQDADCDGQPRRGCPAALTGDEACDADGDGFPSARAGCDPGGQPTDCDDADPQTFPGAPDRCGDGRAQNCSTDRPCVGDGDGDGYAKELDCDDADPAVHPFAAERCNGKDDDCDGLIDEQNPDARGDRLLEERTASGKKVRGTTSCTDSDVGDCGLRDAATGALSGRCVCTAAVPSAPHEEGGKRTACPGARDDDRAAPKCFFARQPGLQTCEADQPRDEDCDGRTDAPEGKNLKEYGEACGVSTGACRAGKVVGCDRGKLNPFSPSAGRSVSPPFPDGKRFLVCDDKTVAPADEACNGRDDDCDGKLPGQGGAAPLAAGDEADHDGDKYLACAGCAGKDLPDGVLGCDDCDDLRAQSYPGAKELCDGRDNGCAGAGYADGKDDCKDAPLTACCAGVPMCIDVQVTLSHCGMCGRACDPKRANKCQGGACLCGDLPACDGAKPVCKDGACVECVADGDCKDPLKPTCAAGVCT